MSTAKLVEQLHDKATRGIALSALEQAQLDAWYAQQDQGEGALLTLASPPGRLVALQTQVDTAVAELLTTTRRVQALAADNVALRRDIAALQEELTRPSPAQSA